MKNIYKKKAFSNVVKDIFEKRESRGGKLVCADSMKTRLVSLYTQIFLEWVRQKAEGGF